MSPRVLFVCAVAALVSQVCASPIPDPTPNLKQLKDRERFVHEQIRTVREAIEESEVLVKELTQLADQYPAHKVELLTLLLQVHRDRVDGMVYRGRLVEAILAAHAIKNLCSLNAGIYCPPLLFNNSLGAVENVIAKKGSIALLGLDSAEDKEAITDAHYSVVQILKKDDPDTYDIRQELLDRVNKAYEENRGSN